MPQNLTYKDFQPIKKLTQRGDRGTQNNGIYLTKHLASNKVYIEKRLTPSFYAKREVKAMHYCSQHPHLVSIFAFSLHSSTSLSIYMQHCELGSLDALILRYNAHSTRLQDEGFLFRVFWHLALGVCFLWSGSDYASTRQRAFQGKCAVPKRDWVPILHRDIKPGNIFVTRDPACMCADSLAVYPCIVLGDFGCAVPARNAYARSPGGDPRFAPPERSFAMQSDVFCIGTVMHCLARMARFPDMTQMQNPLGRQYTGSEHLAHMVGTCMARRPEDRPSPMELPKMVFEGYRVWRQARGSDGDALPKWAFG